MELRVADEPTEDKHTDIFPTVQSAQETLEEGCTVAHGRIALLYSRLCA